MLFCIFLIFLSFAPIALFCDYYNLDGECEWHYESCGKPCMKTCRNPSGKCYNQIPPLEGTDDMKVMYAHLLISSKTHLSY